MFNRRESVTYATGGKQSNTTYNASLVSMTILGLSMIFVGTYYINWNLQFVDFDYVSFSCSNCVFSLLLMLYALYAIKTKMVSEGVLYLLTAIISILSTVSEYYYDMDLVLLMPFFGVGFLGCAFVFSYRKQWMLTIVSVYFFVYSLITKFFPWDYLFTSGAMLFVLGLGLVLVGCSTMIGMEFGSAKLYVPRTTTISDEEYPEIFEDTVGAILLAFITFLYVYAVFFNYEVGQAYYILTFIVSTITLFAAIYGIYHGVLGSTVLMFLLALSKLIFTIFGFIGLGSTTHIDLILVIIFIPLCISFFMKGQMSMIILTAATAMTTIAQTFTGYVFFVEGAMAITNIVAIYHALTTWYHADTGERIRDNVMVRWMMRRLGHGTD